MFSPRLSVLLVSEALVIYIVKFVNRQVRQSVGCSGSVILFFFLFFLFFFFHTDRVHKIMKYLMYFFLLTDSLFASF